MKVEATVNVNYSSIELARIIRRLDKMGLVIDNLVREVSESRTVQASAIVLLNALKLALDEAIANNDLSAVEQVAADLDAGQAELVAAITANTPSDPSA